MKKFLLSALLSAALIAPASAASLAWNLPAPTSGNPTDLVSITIFDQTGSPPANLPIGSVGPTVTSFPIPTTLPPGSVHTFTAVAVYGEGNAPPSNSVVFTVTVTLAPVTNLRIVP